MALFRKRFLEKTTEVPESISSKLPTGFRVNYQLKYLLDDCPEDEPKDIEYFFVFVKAEDAIDFCDQLIKNDSATLKYKPDITNRIRTFEFYPHNDWLIIARDIWISDIPNYTEE